MCNSSKSLSQVAEGSNANATRGKAARKTDSSDSQPHKREELAEPDPAKIMSTNGVRMSFFNNLAEKWTVEKRTGMPTTDVNVRFVSRWTKQTSLSLCEQILRDPKSVNAINGTDQVVGEVSWFISHAWKYPFLSVIEAINLFFERKRTGLMHSSKEPVVCSLEVLLRFGDKTAVANITKFCYGLCLLYLGHSDDALHALEEKGATEEIAAITVELRLALAIVYQKLGRLQEALPLLEKVFPVSKLHCKAEIWLKSTFAKVYADLVRVDDALDSWCSLEQFAVGRYGRDDSITKIFEIEKFQNLS
ncbi:hypothetical protein HK100_003925 [Physocladia obscura]|uniref:Uncharacterized protein n=1 Tax=Physocladia obscura TaxID=109957 RepID=A0AAD5SZD2_9FUNG|nr:hypothetical protein HK100_003925 [Physocladia obscura]